MRRPESSEAMLAHLKGDYLQPKAPQKFDLRNYGIGAQILKDLGVTKMKLLARPRKMPSMAGFNLEVTGYLSPDGK
jgi:3,4-dihydroxy 2-butanone 4-phosphate synthase/GTP cyclohydrolase II